MSEGIAIVPSAPVFIRNNDVEHDYRQDSDLYYLTGFDEPETVLVLCPGREAGEAVLFVRKRDPERETWDGKRAGVDGAVADYGMDEAFEIGEFDERLPQLMENQRRIYYRIGHDRAFDERVLGALNKVRGRVRTGVVAPSEFVDLAAPLHEMRLLKSDAELATIERAGGITRTAHLRAMEIARPGRFEYEVEAELMRVFRDSGAERPAYGSIVGSGPNATILHHRRNDRQMLDGDLLLIDAGVELDYYASDVTRTFPVGGTFSPAQREIYEVVLAAQGASIDAVKPGNTLNDVHEAAVRVLAEGMIALGLIEGTLDEALQDGRYKKFYMHKTSHFLGMDVHDVGNYFVDRSPRPLEPGMVLTVEPGLYVAEDAQAPEAYRGIGVRIEDDIAVTETGHRNLTPDIPKTVDEIERILASRS